jgi:hypothetical protein
MDDTTLGGYQQVHGRPPAFGASDGCAYSVATFADDTAEAGRFGAALLFVCWGDAGEGGVDRPVGHLETDYLAYGNSPDEALAPLLALTLEQVKDHLDRCVARQPK